MSQLTKKLSRKRELLVFGYIRIHIADEVNNKRMPFEIKHLCACFYVDFEEWDTENSSEAFLFSSLTDCKVVTKKKDSYYPNAFGTVIVNIGDVYVWKLRVIQRHRNTLIVGVLPSEKANKTRANLDDKKVGHQDFSDEYSVDISNDILHCGRKIHYCTNNDIYEIKLDLCRFEFSVKRKEGQWVVIHENIKPTTYKLAYSTYYKNNGFEILDE